MFPANHYRQTSVRRESTLKLGAYHTLIGEGHLRLLLKDYHCVFDENTTKYEMAKILGDTVGYRELERLTHVGLPAVEFQRKFNINNYQIKKLVRTGLLHVTGKECFYSYDHYIYADLYSIYDFFELRDEDVKKLSKM